MRMAHPDELPGLVLIDSPQPLRAPVRIVSATRLFPHLGHGRERAHRRHVGAVVNLVDPLQGTAHVVHVIGEAIIGGVDRDDRTQLRGALARELEGVEPAVRRTKHADAPGAPGLCGEPGDGLREVTLLRLGIFIRRATAAAAGAAHIDARDGIPELGGEALILRSPTRGHIVLAIGQCLEDARRRRDIGEEERDAEVLPVG